MKPPWKRSRDAPAVPEPVREERTVAVQPPSHPGPLERELLERLETLSRRCDLLDQTYDEIGDRLDRLTVALAEGIEHTDRAERRVRATVARARRDLEANGLVSPGLEAEYDQLRDRDGEEGEERGVQPVRENVGGDPSRAVALGDAFPGAWTEGDLASLMDS